MDARFNGAVTAIALALLTLRAPAGIAGRIAGGVAMGQGVGANGPITLPQTSPPARSGAPNERETAPPGGAPEGHPSEGAPKPGPQPDGSDAAALDERAKSGTSETNTDPSLESAPVDAPAGLDQPAGAAKPVIPIVEARSLGQRNNLLSARPTAPAGEEGWLGGLDPTTNEITRVLGALAAIIGLLFLARALLRKGGAMVSGGDGGGRPSGVLEVLARYPIGRGQQLILLKLARRILLLHQSAGNGGAMRPLAEVDDPDEVAALLSRMEAGSSGRNAGRFRETLESFQAEHEASTARPVRNRAALPSVETEVVDLTKSPFKSKIRGGGGITGLLARRATR